MKKSIKRALLVGVSVLAMAGFMAGCGNDQEDAKTAKSAPGFPVSWSETLNGQQVNQEVMQSPKRAVSMSQATTEMMLALGLEDKMAGTAFKEEEIYEPLQGAYSKVKVLAEKWPSYEVLMAEKPDFVTGWEVPFTKRGIPAEKILDQKVPIFVPQSMQKLDANLDTLFDDMIKLGAIFDKKITADEWVATEKKKLAAVQEKIGKLPHKKVFVFDSEDDKPFTVFKGYTTNILALIGADNVMANAGVDKTWATTSWEDVVAANPDYIIICDYSTSARNDDDFKAKVEKIKNNPQLQNITAVKENRFIKVRLSEITPGVRTVDALVRLAGELHK